MCVTLTQHADLESPKAGQNVRALVVDERY